MAYLNWHKSQHARAERSTHAKYQTQITLYLGQTELKDLAHALTETLLKNPDLQANAEVRTDFLHVTGNHTDKWTLYWKIKFGQSRMTLAHPNADEWVASITLNREHAEKTVALITLLQTTTTDLHIALGGSTTLAALSNLELILKRAS